MQTHEIPQSQWGDFFFALAEQCRDARVRVEVDGRDLGEQPLGEHLPLVDIEVERKGSARGDITLTFVLGERETLEHRIALPQHVWVAETERGEVAVLNIEDGAQQKTLVSFEQPVRRPSQAP